MENQHAKTCDFCFNKPLLQATGNNGELKEVSCPKCHNTTQKLIYVAIYKKDSEQVV